LTFENYLLIENKQSNLLFFNELSTKLTPLDDYSFSSVCIQVSVLEFSV